MAGVTEQRHGAVAVIKPDGPCIQEQAEALGQAALSKVRPLMGRMVIDMSASAYVDSIGLETLLDLADELDKPKGHEVGDAEIAKDGNRGAGIEREIANASLGAGARCAGGHRHLA